MNKTRREYRKAKERMRTAEKNENNEKDGEKLRSINQSLDEMKNF